MCDEHIRTDKLVCNAWLIHGQRHAQQNGSGKQPEKFNEWSSPMQRYMKGVAEVKNTETLRTTVRRDQIRKLDRALQKEENGKIQIKNNMILTNILTFDLYLSSSLLSHYFNHQFRFFISAYK